MSLRRVYESTIIVNAALDNNDIEGVISKVTGYIENHGGKTNEIHKWGRRRLVYPINKKYNGFYVHIEFEATPNTVPILERFLILEDTVLRHLTLLLPEKLKIFRESRASAEGSIHTRMAQTAQKNDSNSKNVKPLDRKGNFTRKAVEIRKTEVVAKPVETEKVAEEKPVAEDK
jgi:small subunit ribosomal protein S6